MSENSPRKPAKLVVEAIRHLKSKRGFTPTEIVRYIQANHEVSDRTIRGVHTALKRGETYGFLRSERGKYILKESPTLSQLVLGRRNHDDSDPDLKGLCKPRRSSRRRKSRGRRGGKCSCGKRRRGSRKSRRRRHSSRGSKCGKRRGSRSRSRRRRGGKRRCSCGKKRRGGRRRSRRGGRKKCGGGRRRGRGGRGRSRRRSRRGGRRSRRRRAKCRC